MGLLQFLTGRAAGAAKSSSAGKLFAWHAVGQPRWTPRRFDKLAEEGYRRNVVAYRCVRTIATACASARWLLYGRRGQEFSEHKLLDLLARPNPVQGGSALLESLVGFFLISGNSYLEAAGPDQGPPRELYALRPDRMKVVPGPTGLPAGYEYSVQGRKHVFPADALSGASPILHFKAFNPLDDWYGLSPIEAAAYSIDQHNAAGVWNQALLQNSARPSGALVFSPKDGPASLSDAQFERLKAEIDEQYSGARQAGRPLLLEGGLDWKEMSLSPKDMDFLNAKLQSARDVAAAFGVPPMLVGVPGDSTYANYREARLALWEETILPLLDFIADQLNHWLSPRFGDHLKLAYDQDVISALSPRREEAWARVQGAEFLTLNEKRAAVGYAPLEGGDELPMLIAQPVEPEDEPDEPETVPITLPFDLARAARLKARPARLKFDPNQPRDPEGSPTGGQWTDGGGGGSGGGGDISGGSGDDTLEGDIDADDLAGAEYLAGMEKPNPWPDTPLAPDFREKLAEKESGGVRGDKWAAKNGLALGRYQIGKSAQQDLGMRAPGKLGKWIPRNKYGVKDEAAFLANHKAQERALADYVVKLNGYLRDLEPLTGVRATDHIGQQIVGVLAQQRPDTNKPFKISLSGLIAAGHRRGATDVAKYLQHQKRNHWRSDFSKLSKDRGEAFEEIETRLREFENIGYLK